MIDVCRKFLSEPSYRRHNISNDYSFDMVLAKDREHSSVLRVDVETFDFRLTASSKFLPSTLLHMDYALCAYLLTGQCFGSSHC
jgi:hypothetical protein